MVTIVNDKSIPSGKYFLLGRPLTVGSLVDGARTVPENLSSETADLHPGSHFLILFLESAKSAHFLPIAISFP